MKQIRTLARLLGLGLLLVVLASCVHRELEEKIVENRPAGPKPLPVPEFLAQDPESIYPVGMCRLDEEYCYHVTPTGAPDFIARLGAYRYSEPVERDLTFRAQRGVYSKQGLVKRWFSCFISGRDQRLFIYYSKDNKFLGPSLHSIGAIFVIRPENEKYQETKDKCGPFTGQV